LVNGLGGFAARAAPPATSTVLELGKLAPIDIDITGVLRLKIGWQPTKSSSCNGHGNDAFDFGEAKLLGVPGEVPTPTTTG
jgi:serine/threonine-protein kinase